MCSKFELSFGNPLYVALWILRPDPLKFNSKNPTEFKEFKNVERKSVVLVYLKMSNRDKS